MQQPRPALPHPWRLLALLVLSIFINYIDRANLAVAAEDLRRDLLLRPSQLGLLLSAFFWESLKYRGLTAPFPAPRGR